MPPTASAWPGSGGVSVATVARASARRAACSSLVGGSPYGMRADSRSDPRSTERSHAAPSSTVPTAICVEPPPTSHTATAPSAELPSSAPSNARRASSSRESTRAPTPAAREIDRTSWSELRACRPGEATTTSISAAPAARASVTKPATHSTVSASFGAEIAPLRSTSAPSPITCFPRATAEMPSGEREPTRSRTVFEPTSMTATFIVRSLSRQPRL